MYLSKGMHTSVGIRRKIGVPAWMHCLLFGQENWSGDTDTVTLTVTLTGTRYPGSDSDSDT